MAGKLTDKDTLEEVRKRIRGDKDFMSQYPYRSPLGIIDVLEKMINTGEIKGKKCLIDIGCGSGLLLKEASYLFDIAIGFDRNIINFSYANKPEEYSCKSFIIIGCINCILSILSNSFNFSIQLSTTVLEL